MKLAIFHDWLVNYGGAERTVEILHSIYPHSPIYTSVLNLERLPETFKKMDIRTSFLQKFPKAKNNYQKYLPIMPIVFENFDTSEFDIVLSSSHSCAKGIITRPHTQHICYCYTPMRYAWDFYHLYINKLGAGLKKIGYIIMNYLRLWDFCAAQRVDYFIAISNTVQKRILKYYRRNSEVIYPPVETSFFTPAETATSDDYYLIVSRLVPYKRVDIAISVFNELKDRKLKIIGGGEEYKFLQKTATGKNIEFIKKTSDNELREYYRNCKALIFTAEEDFGIVPVEAQSCGKPVIAYKSGGATETVIENKTGCFFYPQTKESLINAIIKFEKTSYDKKTIRENAVRFDKEIFKNKIKTFIEEKYAGRYTEKYK